MEENLVLRVLIVFISSIVLNCGTQSQQDHSRGELGIQEKSTQPNFVFILTDDLSSNLLQFMPNVLKMQLEGVTFSNYFVTDSVCCPSRATIFTGRYPHNTGVLRNVGDGGGYQTFIKMGLQNETFAVSLSASGYRTAMLGKYLNGYEPTIFPRDAGWSEWDVAGDGYSGYNYYLLQNNSLVYYGDKPQDFLPDVLSGLAVRFIKNDPENKPFFIEIAPFTPHAPFPSAPRDAGRFPRLTAPRSPAFNAVPAKDAPAWLRTRPPLTYEDIKSIDETFQKRARSVLAIDRMIGDLRAAVAATGHENNTYFIFSSDNGLHLGEHRLRAGKLTSFDIDIHVPLIITGPGIPAGSTTDYIAANTDLCPTFTELAGANAPVNMDGRSLVPLLQGKKPVNWRTAILIEHYGPLIDPLDPDAPFTQSGNPPTYFAIRAKDLTYVEYVTGEKEFRDLTADAYELTNTYAELKALDRERLHSALSALKNCHGSAACWSAEHPDLNIDR